MNPTENHTIDTDVLESGFGHHSTIDFLMQEHGVVAQSIAIIRGGALAEVRNFGRQNEEALTSVDTIYNVASLAKPVSALLTLRLVDQGLWDLDTPLIEYHLDPELADSPQARHVTTRHVLSHSSGLPNWRYLTDDGTLAFDFEPGEGYQYSGEGFEWLRQAIEAKLGKSWDVLAREHVFIPARMWSTSYLYPRAADAERVADRYDGDGQLVNFEVHNTANAAANLMTTAEDYGRFVAFTARGAGLSDVLATDMVTSQIVQSDTFDFGLGWQISKVGAPVLQHSGSDPGVRSLAMYWTDTGDGLVILSNSDGAIQTWQLIITDLFGERGWDVLTANGR